MLKKSSSKSSFQSHDKNTPKISKADPLQLSEQIQAALQQASKILPHKQFAPLFQNMIKNLVRRAEVESPNSQVIYLQTIKACLGLYGGSLQLNVRVLLLEILSDLGSNLLQEIPTKINKAKHIVLQTHIEYLLSKIFILQQKYHLLMDDEASALKSLKKCLQLNEEHMIEFMQQQEDIRKEIVDYAILAYYQSFKIKKSNKPQNALQVLLKACNIAKRNYGNESKITRGLYDLYNQQENIINSLEKASIKSRAITEIIDYQNKKNYRTAAFYSWEDEKIIVQLIKTKGKTKQVISQTSYDIKLDINKIRLLQNTQWLSISKDGQVGINEDDLLRILGFQHNQSNQKQMTTGIEIKNLSRDQIIKKTYVSSSEDEPQIFSKPELIWKIPRVHSSRKFKQTQ